MLRTALVITIDGLQLIQLDVVKKKLLSAAVVGLPPETIKRGFVANPEVLTKACQEVFSKASVPVKQCVLVIPEDAAISKTIGLPSMNHSEIDEAVRWEAEAFLPYQLKEAFLDWQKIGTNEKARILFLAVKTEIIDTYIRLLDLLGVEVVAVETPALSLVRLAENKPGTRLLIYAGNQEAILTLANNQEVIATSVVPAKSDLDEAIKKTVLHMQAYYRDFSIEWIQVGGLRVSQKLIQELQVFKLPVGGFVLPEYIDSKTGGTLLMGISAALKEVLPPSDDTSINLLPQWYLDATHKVRQKQFWGKLLIALTLFFAVTTASLFVTWNYLMAEKSKLASGSSKGQVAQQALLEAVNTTNTLSKTVQTLANGSAFPLELINTLESKQHSDVRLVRLQLMLSEKSGELNGVAIGREALLRFKQNLEQESQLSGITMPISNLTEEADIPFGLKFKLTDKNAKKYTL